MARRTVDKREGTLGGTGFALARNYLERTRHDTTRHDLREKIQVVILDKHCSARRRVKIKIWMFVHHSQPVEADHGLHSALPSAS